MVRPKKLSAKPAAKRTLKASAPPSPKPPHQMGRILKPAQFKAEIDTPNSPYIEIAPLIEHGKAARAAQRRGVEANMKNKILQKERFLTIFREVKTSAGVRPQKKNLISEAVAKFNQDYGKLSERAAWNYLKGFD